MFACEVKPVFLRPDSVRVLCRRPYWGHPKGCPNWGKQDTCPPRAPLLYDLLDPARPVYAVWNRFDLAAHVARMREKHPDWSDRQLYCCLYWQPRARKQLREHVIRFMWTGPLLREVGCPEACGVNVTATLAEVGITLEWPPRQWVYQVALVGFPV